MMTAFVVCNAQATPFRFFAVNGESSETLSTPAFAGYDNPITLRFGCSHVASIQETWKKARIDQCVNCGNRLTVTPRQIRSQAPQECGEGSTTRAWSPERTVKPHERTPRKGRDSLDSWETMRSGRINSPAITYSPWTGMLDSMSKWPIRQPVMKALKADANRDLDQLASVAFNTTVLRYSVVASSAGIMSTDGTATASNSHAFETIHWKDIVDKMRERNIPYYTESDYVAIGWRSTFRNVKNTLETLHQYTDSGMKLIFNGELGRYENTRIVEQSNVAKGYADNVTYDAYGADDAWDNGKSSWIYFIGEDAVAEAIAIPMEVRAKVATDFGRSQALAWYALLGYSCVYGNVAAQAPNGRIVKWTSAG